MKKSISPTVGKLLSEGKIIEAIELLHPRIASLTSHPEYVTQLHNLRDTYTRMLDFFSKGYPDPERNEMIETICRSLRDLSESVDYESKVLENEGFYYAQVRADRLSPENITKLLESYQSLVNMLTLTGGDSDSTEKLRTKRDDLLQRAFTKVMILRSPSAQNDFTFLISMIKSEEYPISSRLQVISALILDLMTGYDRGVFSTLLGIYEQNGNARIQAKALSGVFIALHLYSNNITSDKELMSRLTLLGDSIMAYSQLREIVLTMIRTRDTGRINEKFRREVLDNFKDISGNGNMLKTDILRSDSNGEEFELNPEWQEFLEKTGIEKKLRKFSELQSEGADLMMITFAQLKNFSFFRNPANWFLPFDPTHSALKYYREMTTEALDAFMNLPGVMCDSDKFSLALSLSQMPTEQRFILTSQLEAQQEQLNAEYSSKHLGTPNPDFSNEVLMTMRSLYRFIRLFNGAATCFHDPFENPVDITAIPALQELLREEEVLQLVSELYFRQGYYTEALKLFQIMEKTAV